ncbi:MAG: sugar phosphate nucleotidyltransferase, partial [Clostridium sp.]
PKSTNASMGIYIFKWELLKKYLKEDELNLKSSNDFGKDILPKMLEDNARMMAYPFKGYWKDVGTIESLWEANMDLLNKTDELNLHENSWKIYSQNPIRPAQYIGKKARVVGSLVVEGCIVEGFVENSILSQGVSVGENTIIRDSVIMPNVTIGNNVIIDKAIVGTDAIIGDGYKVTNGNEISVVAASAILECESIFINDDIDVKSIELKAVECFS